MSPLGLAVWFGLLSGGACALGRLLERRASRRSRDVGYESGRRAGQLEALGQVQQVLDGAPALSPSSTLERVESLRLGLSMALSRCHGAKDEMQAVRNALEGGPVPEADPAQPDSGWALAQRVAGLFADRQHVYRGYVDQFMRRIAVAGALEHLVELVHNWPGERAALVAAVDEAVAAWRADRENKPRLAVLNPCTVCELPIELGSFIGAGDGSMKDGGRFAHPVCYWRREAERLEGEKRLAGGGGLARRLTLQLEEVGRDLVAKVDQLRAAYAVIGELKELVGQWTRLLSPPVMKAATEEWNRQRRELVLDTVNTIARVDGMLEGQRSEVESDLEIVLARGRDREVEPVAQPSLEGSAQVISTHPGEPAVSNWGRS